MREQRLIDARDQLLAIARQEFESNVDVVGLFVAGSLAAGSHDAYSDIDLRVVVKPEKQQWFIEHRREIPRAWPGFLFNEWRRYKALRVALSILCENRYLLLWRKRPAAVAMACVANHNPVGLPRRHPTDGACFGAPGIRRHRRGSRFFNKQSAGCDTRDISTHAPRRIGVRANTAG